MIAQDQWSVNDHVRLSPDGVALFERFGAHFQSTGRITWAWRNAVGTIIDLAPRGRLIAVAFHWGVEAMHESFLEPCA